MHLDRQQSETTKTIILDLSKARLQPCAKEMKGEVLEMDEGEHVGRWTFACQEAVATL